MLGLLTFVKSVNITLARHARKEVMSYTKHRGRVTLE